MGDRIIITIHLPANIDDIAAMLAKVADIWPNARVDTESDAGGWIIELPAIER